MFSANMTIAIVFACKPYDSIFATRNRTLELSIFLRTLITTPLMTLNILSAIKSTRMAVREPASERSLVGLDMVASDKYGQFSLR